MRKGFCLAGVEREGEERRFVFFCNPREEREGGERYLLVVVRVDGLGRLDLLGSRRLGPGLKGRENVQRGGSVRKKKARGTFSSSDSSSPETEASFKLLLLERARLEGARGGGAWILEESERGCTGIQRNGKRTSPLSSSLSSALRFFSAAWEAENVSPSSAHQVWEKSRDEPSSSWAWPFAFGRVSIGARPEVSRTRAHLLVGTFGGLLLLRVAALLGLFLGGGLLGSSLLGLSRQDTRFSQRRPCANMPGRKTHLLPVVVLLRGLLLGSSLLLRSSSLQGIGQSQETANRGAQQREKGLPPWRPRRPPRRHRHQASSPFRAHRPGRLR